MHLIICQFNRLRIRINLIRKERHAFVDMHRDIDHFLRDFWYVLKAMFFFFLLQNDIIMGFICIYMVSQFMLFFFFLCNFIEECFIIKA
jgi:hypothetical protein